ncbi:hypothetical protein [Streptomyces sp. NPDC058758]|uniref:hypothetical protein n=1 Tax=Streptomyces sp. NPDC058758 TaxID=3346627 RepID=UPI0036B73F38
MAKLTPSPDRPGLHVSKLSPSEPATASAVCHCGATATATGDAQVGALVAGWNAHHGPAHKE